MRKADSQFYIIKKTLAIFLLACCSALWPVTVCGQSAGENPAASSESYVVFGNARFTVLTPRLVRMEWSADGKFEDRATLGIVNRRPEVPDFTVRETKNSVTVRTDFLTLKYHGQEKFDKDNLSITFLISENGKEKGEWHPGMDDSGNLLGTARTLDRFEGGSLMDPYDPGIISRDGWAVIDESSRHLFERQHCPSGPVFLRLRSRLYGGIGRLYENRREDTASAKIRLRLLVVQVLAVFRFRTH